MKPPLTVNVPTPMSDINPINLPQLVPPAAIMAGEKPLSTLYFMRCVIPY